VNVTREEIIEAIHDGRRECDEAILRAATIPT